jgi:hypothetical protein
MTRYGYCRRMSGRSTTASTPGASVRQRVVRPRPRVAPLIRGSWFVGTVGRMQPVKDQPNLARAFRRTAASESAAEGPAAAGHRPDRPALRPGSLGRRLGVAGQLPVARGGDGACRTRASRWTFSLQAMVARYQGLYDQLRVSRRLTTSGPSHVRNHRSLRHPRPAPRWLSLSGTLSFGVFFLDSYVITAGKLLLGKVLAAPPEGGLVLLVGVVFIAVGLAMLLAAGVRRLLGPQLSRMVIGT